MSKKPFVLQAAIYSALRRLHRRHPAYSAVLNRCKKEYFIPSKKGSPMRRVHFQCEQCGLCVDRKKFAVDHIDTVIPLQGLPKYGEGPDYNVYIERLFCDVNNLQGLCKTCHDVKTKAENKIRRERNKPVAKKPKKK